MIEVNDLDICESLSSDEQTKAMGGWSYGAVAPNSFHAIAPNSLYAVGPNSLTDQDSISSWSFTTFR